MHAAIVPSPAAALRSARRSAGLGQRALARRAGLSAGALSRYEAGAALPSLATLDRVLAACGKDVRLVVVDRADDLEAELGRRAADTEVLVGGAWAADLHGIPSEAVEGR